MASNPEATVQLFEIQLQLLTLLTGPPREGQLIRIRASLTSPEGVVEGSVGDLVVTSSPAALYEKVSGDRTSEGWSLVAGSGVSEQTVADSRGLGAADSNRLLLVDSSDPVVISLGDSPANFWCEVVRYGTGTVTFAASGSTPIRSAGGALAISAQYAGATVTRVSDAWLVVGSLS